MADIARKLNILVVDDDQSIVRIITKYLEQGLEGTVEVTGLTDPAEAKTWIDERCCDILISDIEMPDINGIEMLKYAKERNAWTQVIFLTGHSTWDRIAEAIENGASDYLLKPIERDELIRLISEMCERFARWQTAVLATLEMGVAA